MAYRPRTAQAEAFLAAFGRRIRDLRRERRLSQEKLGELADIDRQTVNRLENASHAISTAHLAALADALGVAPSELMPSLADYAASADSTRPRAERAACGQLGGPGMPVVQGDRRRTRVQRTR